MNVYEILIVGYGGQPDKHCILKELDDAQMYVEELSYYSDAPVQWSEYIPQDGKNWVCSIDQEDGRKLGYVYERKIGEVYEE